MPFFFLTLITIFLVLNLVPLQVLAFRQMVFITTLMHGSGANFSLSFKNKFVWMLYSFKMVSIVTETPIKSAKEIFIDCISEKPKGECGFQTV